MYLRLLRIETREDGAAGFQSLYHERILPTLRQTPGCLYAGLLREWPSENDFQSLTLWDSAESARRYEAEGTFGQLVQEAEPFFASSTEWRMRLWLPGGEPPAEDGIHAKTFFVGEEGGAVEIENGTAPYVRIVNLRVKPERVDEFREIFNQKIIPALRATEGCQGIFLAEGAQDPNSFLSVTVWRSEEDSVRYELSGTFDRLTALIRDTLQSLSRWKVALGPGGTEAGESLEVKGYHWLQGERT